MVPIALVIGLVTARAISTPTTITNSAIIPVTVIAEIKASLAATVKSDNGAPT